MLPRSHEELAAFTQQEPSDPDDPKGGTWLPPCDLGNLLAATADRHHLDLERDFTPNSHAEPYRGTALEQYQRLGRIKSSEGSENSDPTSIKYLTYLSRLERLTSFARGVVLDIGCGDGQYVVDLLPPSCNYVGIDPAGDRYTEARPILQGTAEFLPFVDSSFDTVCFLTSLDHVLDYNLAIEEAKRVLKPGGRLLLATLVWVKRAELWRDDVHWHHFRPGQLEASLEGFTIAAVDCYPYGLDVHRYGAFIAADVSTQVG